MNSEEFVSGVIEYYEESGMTPGNPDDGKWENCHYPVPEVLGGTATIKLIREHHCILDVIISGELEGKYFYGDAKRYLVGPWAWLLPTFAKYAGQYLTDEGRKRGLETQKASGRTAAFNAIGRKVICEMFKQGIHPFQTEKVRERSRKSVSKANKSRMKSGTHGFQRRVCCLNCHKEMTIANFSRHIKSPNCKPTFG